jgi:hypothetical protein
MSPAVAVEACTQLGWNTLSGPQLLATRRTLNTMIIANHRELNGLVGVDVHVAG